MELSVMSHNILDKERDNRSESKLKWDYSRAKENEIKVMKALVNQLYAERGINCWYEEVESEYLGDNRLHINPDYFFYCPAKTTFEIKYSTTGNFKNDTVYVKPAAIFSMTNSARFPNGRLIIATATKYTILTVPTVIKYPLEVCEDWSNEEVKKKAFHIPFDSLDWKEWLSKIK
jgi:hypothetical protein